MKRKITSKIKILFQIISLLFLIGVQVAFGSEVPPQSELKTNQDGNTEEISKSKLPLIPEAFNVGPAQKNFVMDGEFLVKIKDALLQKIIDEKSIISTEEAMKIWREHWLDLKKEKGRSQKEQSFLSEENLNKLGARRRALEELKKIFKETKSKPEILQTMELLGILVLKTAEKGVKADRLKMDLLNAIKKAKPGIINDIGKSIIVEQNYKLELQSHRNEEIPNDFHWQTDLEFQLPDGPKLSHLWGLNKIHMKEAWKTAGVDWDQPVQKSIILAVIDTGIMVGHPDLKGNIWKNSNELVDNEEDDDLSDNEINGPNIRARMNKNDCKFPDKQIEGNPFDEQGHGTHVAGIAVAIGNNDDIKTKDSPKGMTGVAGNSPVEVMAVKIFCIDKRGSYDGSYSHALEAIGYANKMGAHIVNISWLLPLVANNTEILKLTMQSAKDLLFVISAGNEDEDIDEHNQFPASFGSELENVLTVAATTVNDDFWPGSNKGHISVHLAAPGDAIYSTLFLHQNPTITPRSGTSMAAPFVAGCAAFVQAVRQSRNLPLLTPQKLREILMESGDHIPTLDGGVIGGKRLNCDRALQKALERD